ncbi:TetR family transcriptional regulator [Agromyces bauzanensis]
MGRWEADAQGRLRQAALELFTERGYEQTTVAEIAERAGVTERTFFRYFADKREVLFDRSNALQNAVVSSIEAADPPQSPLEAVVEALASAGELLEGGRDSSRLRTAAIAATPSLQERELLKLFTLAAAAAEALHAKGVPDPTARLAAESGVSIFRVGFERWIADDADETLARSIRAVFAELKALT